MAIRNTFKVYERLKREQHIHTLFLTGKAFSVFPIKLIYGFVPRPDSKAAPVLAGFSVPKKKFRSSVHRHRVRRLMVEAWRLHKQPLYETMPANQQMHLFFIFTDRAMPQYEPIKTAMIKGVEKLITMVKKETISGA